MILICDCKNEWMDQRYGKNKRVCNPMKIQQNGKLQFRCANCSKVIESGKRVEN